MPDSKVCFLSVLFFCWISQLYCVRGQIYGSSKTKCDYDPNCFTCTANCALARAKPFERRTPMTCEQCLNLCLSLSSTDGKFVCRTVVYDSAYQSCDIFAVTQGAQYPAVNYVCRDMCVPTGRCSSVTQPPTTTRPPVPVEATCRAGEVVKFLATSSAAMSGTPDATIPSITHQACARVCAANEDQKGNVQPCRSVSYSSGTCQIYSDAAFPAGSAMLKQQSNSVYMEKTCLPRGSFTNCGDVIEQWPRFRLVGFAMDVLSTRTYDECLRECAASPTCASAMYFEADNVDNCILNSATKETHPDLFGPDDLDGAVTYFQPDCPDRVSLFTEGWHALLTPSDVRKASKKFQGSVLRDEGSREKIMVAAGVKLNHWTHWSNCELATNTQVRYKVCSKVDVRECENQVDKCSKFGSILREEPEEESTHPLKLGKCVCTVDTNARTRCDVGVRRVRIGSRYKIEPCSNPRYVRP